MKFDSTNSDKKVEKTLKKVLTFKCGRGIIKKYRATDEKKYIKNMNELVRIK